MRSLVIQASSVEKAVEKAWAQAGMPTEFTIKILDFGEKGFLGITKKSAIITILYEPQKQTSISKPQPPQKITLKVEKKPLQKYPSKEKPPKFKSIPPTNLQQEKKPQKERSYWFDSMVNDVTIWLKNIAKTIAITVPFTAEVSRKALTLTFESTVLSSPDEERLLFSSFSYLLIQFMKKKHKKRFQGYQIIVTSKRPIKK